MEVTHEELAKDIQWSFHEPPNEERIEDFKAYRELQFEMVKQTPEKPMSADQDQKSEEWYNFEAIADYLVFIEDYLNDGKVSDVGFEEVNKDSGSWSYLRPDLAGEEIFSEGLAKEDLYRRLIEEFEKDPLVDILEQRNQTVNVSPYGGLAGRKQLRRTEIEYMNTIIGLDLSNHF